MKGCGAASVLEVVEDHQADTYGAGYMMRYAVAVYVLHCFQNKSMQVSPPKPDIHLIAV